MELSIKHLDISIDGGKYLQELCDEDHNPLKMTCITGKDRGYLSHQCFITIEPKDKDKLGYIGIAFNKNEALYLANWLMSFVNEKDIDPDNDED
jgi:hypothetical protein